MKIIVFDKQIFLCCKNIKILNFSKKMYLQGHFSEEYMQFQKYTQAMSKMVFSDLLDKEIAKIIEFR